MKREIEFRGLTKNCKYRKNGEWIYGFYMNKDGKDIIVDTTCGSLGMGLEVIPETVGQYVGITDKNGKKVYVGDIVKTEQGRIGNICFNDGAFCFNVENKYIYALCDSEFGYVYKENADELEVIGTVFDKESDNE